MFDLMLDNFLVHLHFVSFRHFNAAVENEEIDTFLRSLSLFSRFFYSLYPEIYSVFLVGKNNDPQQQRLIKLIEKRKFIR